MLVSHTRCLSSTSPCMWATQPKSVLRMVIVAVDMSCRLLLHGDSHQKTRPPQLHGQTSCCLV